MHDSHSFDVRRLGPDDSALAIELFAMMAAVFETDGESTAPAEESLTRNDAAALLGQPELWVVAATESGVVVGGITAHVLAMTRSRSTELFIYDLAVRVDRQRRGIGRALLNELLSLASIAGVGTAFVAADNEDDHALDFYRAVGGTPSPVTLFTFSR